MKIAYSCAGEGFGHVARMVCLGPLLEKSFDLVYFVPASVRPYFESRLPGRKVYDLPWFSFEKLGDKVLFFKTLARSVRKAFSFVPEVLKLLRRLREEKIQGILSDFDPYLSWAGRVHRCRVVQLNHPGVVMSHLTFDPRSWAAAGVSFLLEGPWTTRLHCSFYDGQVGPLIRPELLDQPLSQRGKWLLHLKPEYRKTVLPALERVGLGPFDLFPNKDGDFDKALARCKGVISSAGHQIISEALVLGKPILVVPQKGQFEQELNARMLRKTRRGMRSDFRHLDHDLIRFKAWAEKFKSLNSPYRDETAKAAALIRSALQRTSLVTVRVTEAGSAAASNG